MDSKKIYLQYNKKTQRCKWQTGVSKKFPNNIKVFIDYTPDTLLKTLESIKKDYGNNISLVFGCGGDRDKKKDR